MSLLNYNRYKICISPGSAKRQGLRTGDVVRRQYFDGKNVIYSLMIVLETGTDTLITPEGKQQESPYFTGALIDGDVPENGQILDFVRTTSLFDEDRSGAMYLTASDSDAPYMDVIDGMARDKSLCYPRNDNACHYTLTGADNLSGEYIPYKDGCSRVFRITCNGAPLTGETGLEQHIGKGLENPQRVIISYKIRACKDIPAIPFTLGYTDGSETDGGGMIEVSTEWDYKLAVIAIDYLPDYERSFKLDLIDLIENEWIEIAELTIIRLSDIATFSDSTKVRVGKVQGIIDPTFGRLDGYGAYFQNLYATRNVNVAGTLTAGDESGFASTFYVGRIHKNCLINSSSGHFTGIVEKAIGGQPPAGIGDVFLIPAGGVTLIAQTRSWAELHQGEKYCFSFWAKGTPGALTVSQNGHLLQETGIDNQWKRYQVPFTTHYEEPDDFLIEIASDVTDVLFCSPQLEKGERATLYQATDSKLADTDQYGAWFARGGIGGTIQNPLLKLNADGSISAGDGSFVINPDGTGYFAEGRFKWTKDTITLQDVTIRWEDFDDQAKENLLTKYVTVTGTNLFHYEDALREDVCEPKEITLFATEYNFTATARRWQYMGSEGNWKDIPGSGSDFFRLLPGSHFWEEREVLTLKYIANLEESEYFETYTISKQYDGADSYSVYIASHNGNVFRNGIISTTLSARVLKGGEDVTELIPDKNFSWTRTGNNPADDALWNSAPHTGKLLEITGEDVYRKAVFDCEVIISTL
ncbi:hypothetical protein [Bacteroides sp.]|uniref:hypothetical protein n=1 Tax=Bacteroides sp. TaxID=29523 RepID=UPI003A8D50EF